MKYWLANIIDEIDFQKKNQEKIAKDLGISGAAFSKNLSGKNEFNFLNMIKLVKELYENHFESTYMIREFCKKTTNKKNIRKAMEYANAIGDLELLRIAVQRGFSSNNTKTYEWAWVYELVWMRSKKIISTAALFEELEERKKSKLVKTTEMKIMFDILTLYTMYDSRDFKLLNERVEKLQSKIGKIQNLFIKKMYSSRVSEWYAYALLMDEQIKKSREVCHSILNTQDEYDCLNLLKVSALGYLGESYVDNYEQSLWYLNKGINLLNQYQFEKVQNRRKEFLNMRSYLRMIHKRDMHSLHIFDEGEWALYYIVTGNKELAIRILRNSEKMKGVLSPMKTCYLGMALGDSNLLEKSIEMFCLRGCRFYSYLPRKMLVEFDKNGIIYMGDAK